ncbi:hypothetical protein SSX86_025293 [Deinandra increscens subsp. villosa]|uniref:LOB domain-containing protein n=1 Tax=Deinandra increscens subsp. villosa TaxID=3103831 RepID=A0AAP0CHN8_9ASTR
MRFSCNACRVLRKAIFRSLLYEACGRMVNPVYGSVGLLWSGSWQLCQDAVEAVLQGSPVTRSDTDEMSNGRPFKVYDIRHVSKDDSSGGSHEIRRERTRGRFKRYGHRGKARGVWIGSGEGESGQNESGLSREMVVEEKSEAEGEWKIGLELRLGYEPVDRCKLSEDVIVDGAFENSDAGAGMDLRLDYPEAA